MTLQKLILSSTPITKKIGILDLRKFVASAIIDFLADTGENEPIKTKRETAESELDKTSIQQKTLQSNRFLAQTKLRKANAEQAEEEDRKRFEKTKKERSKKTL